MKKLIFYSCLLFSLSACNQNSNQAKTETTDTISAGKNSITYTCPMHPKVISNKPGVCPKCGMDLVEKQ